MFSHVENLKKEFPLFHAHPDLVYLDSAATNHMPQSVLNKISNYIQNNGSPHRGAHRLSVLATTAYDEARNAVKSFIGAKDPASCIFVRNATEALNLLAFGFLLPKIQKGDKLVISITAHHSAIVPLQRIAKSKGAELVYLYCEKNGKFSSGELSKIDEKTRFVLIPHISNGIGVIHDVSEVVKKSRSVGAFVAIDGAQSTGHIPIDVEALDVDFFVFSGHKIFAPQGIGVLYGRINLLETFEPFLRGGDMIEYVEEQTATFAPLPDRLEAGTQNVMGAVGLHGAIDYIKKLGINHIASHERELVKYAYSALSAQKGISVLGPNKDDPRGSLIVFTLDGIHPHDVASLLDSRGIAIRAGHHCCQPLMKYLKVQATCRASFSVYNTFDDVDKLIEGLHYVQEVFS